MIKKKVKKVPKYYDGSLAVAMPDMSDFKIQHKLGVAPPNSNSNSNNLNFDIGQIGSAIGGAADLIGMATSGQKATVGTALSGAAKGAMTGMQFGPVGAAIGAAAGLAAGAAGSKNSVNYKTSSTNINHIKQEGSGWMKLLGPSDEEMWADANMVQNNNIAKIQTEQAKANYMNNPNVQLNPVLVAEGGIMRTPVDALVSKGELIYDPVQKKLTKVPGNKGKANTDDDVFTKLLEGWIVVPNSDNSKKLTTNNKTVAYNLEPMVDKPNIKMSKGTIEARDRIIKKVSRLTEAIKDGPQEYAMYGDGTGKVKARKKEKIDYVVWNGKFGYFDAEGGFHDMSDVANPNLPDSTYLGRYEYVDTPVQNSNVKSANVTYPTGAKYPMDPVVIPQVDWNDAVTPTFSPTVYNTRNTASDNKSVVKSKSSITKSPTQDEINAFYGYDRDEVVATERKDRNKRINRKNKKYINDKDLNGGELDEVVVTAPRINKASSKEDTGKKSSSGKTTTTAPKEVKPVEINQTGLDWARQEAAKAMSQYAPNTTRAVAPGLVSPKIDPTEIVEEAALPSSGTANVNVSTGSGSNGSNWQDNLYRMAVLSQPLWDRAKAESVDYTSPVYKYMPTAVDVSSQLRDADQSYALARYNFANLYPNTGAGMAAGLQAASNRAKQYADIRQWQTNAQNELIGKNVGIYNNWANEHARILNDVYNKSAQNRATARNINRQNRAAALSNWGTMLSDDKKMTMDKLKLNMLEPMLQYGYQNYDGYLKWKKSNGYE